MQQQGNKCPSCGRGIPDDSEFCPYCGSPIIADIGELLSTGREPVENTLPKSIYAEEADNSENKTITAPVSTDSITIPTDNRGEEENKAQTNNADTSKTNSSIDSQKQSGRFCKKCGGAIDSDTRKCVLCGKQFFRPKVAIPIIALTVIAVALVGLNVWQFLLGRQASETIGELNGEVSSLNSRIASLNTDISNLNSVISEKEDSISKLNDDLSSKKREISNLNREIENLRIPAEEYESICAELSSGNIGYGAYNFNVDKSVIVLRKTDTSKKITLTANWSYGGTVSVDYSNYNAWLDFDNTSWTYTTTLTVKPLFTGSTVATFSNNVDSNTFKVLIIVTD